ncbi:MAG: hypothetical protein KJ718_04830 [Nanoarchaeota archaeon]|nr:hypothetical protein [Nanoarchaeota archaeon]MBU1051852.1 hypothetical protein [Nanoarchaeota archaeon]MBU1988052.1 hypothetical protein [Nanoarchaeota archaeon]
MKEEEPEETREEKESTLEGLLGLATGLGLAVFHSTQMYKLMDRAGMYVTGELPGVFSELGSPEGVGYQLAAAAGTAALFFGGLYLGRLAGREINRLRRNK